MGLDEVDNLLYDLLAGFGPLGEVLHVLWNLFPEEKVSVLQQPRAVDSFGFASPGEALSRTRVDHGRS